MSRFTINVNVVRGPGLPPEGVRIPRQYATCVANAFAAVYAHASGASLESLQPRRRGRPRQDPDTCLRERVYAVMRVLWRTPHGLAAARIRELVRGDQRVTNEVIERLEADGAIAHVTYMVGDRVSDKTAGRALTRKGVAECRAALPDDPAFAGEPAYVHPGTHYATRAYLPEKPCCPKSPNCAHRRDRRALASEDG